MRIFVSSIVLSTASAGGCCLSLRKFSESIWTQASLLERPLSSGSPQTAADVRGPKLICIQSAKDANFASRSSIREGSLRDSRRAGCPDRNLSGPDGSPCWWKQASFFPPAGACHRTLRWSFTSWPSCSTWFGLGTLCVLAFSVVRKAVKSACRWKRPVPKIVCLCLRGSAVSYFL